MERDLARLDNPAERARRKLDFERRRFAHVEKHLDRVETGPSWLRDAAIARLVSDSMRYRDGKVYTLYAYCVMPNHIHCVFAPLPVAQAVSLCAESPVAQADSLCYQALASIMHSLKGYTAHEANLLLKRTGDFWEHESYDHWVRDADELERIIAYVLNNPVKAGLVTDWKAWRWSYCRMPAIL